MIQLKLYGPVSSTNEYVKLLLKHKIESFCLPVEIVEKTEIEDIIQDRIASVPAVVINQEPPMYINDIDNSVSFVQDVIKRVVQLDLSSDSMHIVVPIDMSDASINALEYAINLARATNANIKIVHFYHPVVTEIDGSVYVDPDEEKNRRETFDSFISEIKAHHNMARYGGIIIESEFLNGFSIEGILQLSKGPGRQMIVMGATGSSKLSKRIFGSVSLEVARRSECPVLIIPESYDRFRIEKLTVALESNQMNKQDVQFLQLLRDRLQANLEVITVSTSDTEIANWSLQLEGLPGADTIPGKFIHSENVLEGIEEYIERNKVDIIIFTPKKRNIFESIFHKSITKNMAINSHVPLLILHHKCQCQHGASCCKLSSPTKQQKAVS